MAACTRSTSSSDSAETESASSSATFFTARPRLSLARARDERVTSLVARDLRKHLTNDGVTGVKALRAGDEGAVHLTYAAFGHVERGERLAPCSVGPGRKPHGRTHAARAKRPSMCA